MKSSSRSRSKQAVTYMEVYGANRVLYRDCQQHPPQSKTFCRLWYFPARPPLWRNRRNSCLFQQLGKNRLLCQ